MTAVAPAPPRAMPVAGTPARSGTVLRRPAVMCLVLFAAYFTLSLASDPRGFLVSDTGGKVATLRAMDARGGLDPDLGYWAEPFDPAGGLHPLANTFRHGDRWLNVTTLPMLYAAVPLYEAGGLRGILVLPMAAGVLVALGSRALARRLGDDSDRAFWLVGLATPVSVYALDFWEHAPGLACMVWGVVLGLDVARGDRAWPAALGAGALFGAAATMRTEALVYAAVTFAVLGIAAWVRQERFPARPTLATAAGFAGVVGLNQLLERAVLGSGLRVGRAAGAGGRLGSGLATRVEDALITTIGVNRFRGTTEWIVGGVLVAALAAATAVFAARRDESTRAGWIALGVAAYGYLLCLASGLGFLPGAFVASPLAVVGLVLARRVPRARPLALLAVVALPAVWAVQYSGGTRPVWGGRYLLLSATLLAVIGVCGLTRLPRRAATALVCIAVLVTGVGVAWAAQRSDRVVAAIGRLPADPATVVVAGEGHLFREGGAFYDPERRWLTARDPAALGRAAGVAAGAGATRLVVVAPREWGSPRDLGVYARRDRRPFAYLPGFDLVVATYRDVARA